MLVEGVELNLEGLTVFPGHINAHDHLEFALFPRLGHGPYPNATAWSRDIYHPDQSPLAEHLRVPKQVRLLWGGLRNLIAGVTTVCHHNPYEAAFDDDSSVSAWVRRALKQQLVDAGHLAAKASAEHP